MEFRVYDHIQALRASKKVDLEIDIFRWTLDSESSKLRGTSTYWPETRWAAMESIDVLVIGAGQAGIAASEHLTSAGIDHVIFERARVVERWRSERWDSLVSNGPAWHDKFPGVAVPGGDPDGFASKDDIVRYFTDYAARIEAPVKSGVDVQSVKRRYGDSRFVVTTNAGTFFARSIIGATGPFAIPTIPPIVPKDAPLQQIHSSQYRNPGQLPEGNVLVVGAGSSGAQIADELLEFGKAVYLSIGPHERPPRRYRGHDFAWWRGMLGIWDTPVPMSGSEHVTMAVSGARGGETIDYRRLAGKGATLLGTTKLFRKGVLRFNEDLRDNIAAGDAGYFQFLDLADRFVEEYGLSLPSEPEARNLPSDPRSLREPITYLDTHAEEITSIIWATGFRPDFSWLQVEGGLDESGRPIHYLGRSTIPDLYYVGLPWLSRRESAFIWGVWHDAKGVVDRLAARRRYIHYKDSLRPLSV